MIQILIRYLGIKTKLLENIKEEILEITPKNGKVLDLFAGSNVVAESLIKERNVYTNDIQKYSYVVGQALVGNITKGEIDELSTDVIFNSSFYQNNLEYLTNTFRRPLEYETEIINKCNEAIKSDSFIEQKCIYQFESLYNNEPYPEHYSKKIKVWDGLDRYYTKEFYEYLRNNKNDNPYMLFTLLFPMPYFSLSQSIKIDSYVCAIDKLKERKVISEQQYNIYLSCLIYYLQCIVTSVGDHFAQPQKFKVIDESKYKKEIVKIVQKKQIDLQQTIENKINEFLNVEQRIGNKCFCLEASELLKSNEINEVTTIYMDPPYTNAHYSRFYHVLETLVKYDYPDFSFNAKYRNDRYQSDFCIKKEAYKSMDNLIRLCNEKQKNIVISYSDTKQCILSKEDIIDICNKYYDNVIVKEIDYLYRNFGQKPNKIKGNELLITCKEEVANG